MSKRKGLINEKKFYGNWKKFLNEDYERGGKYGMDKQYAIVDLRGLYDSLPDEVKQRYEEYAQRPANEKPIGSADTPMAVFKYELRASIFGRSGADLGQMDPLSKPETMLGISGAQGGGLQDNIPSRNTLIRHITHHLNQVGAKGADVESAVRDAQEASLSTRMKGPRSGQKSDIEKKYGMAPAGTVKEETN